MIGAGAGPFQVVGVNCELMNNVKLSGNGPCVNNAYTAKVNVTDQSCVLEKMPAGCNDFGLLGNFLCCEGKPGKVLEVKASQRTGQENFMSSLRKSLLNHYGEKTVGMGGVFLIEKGKAKLHIMPDFSDVPLTCDAEVDGWLNFYEMNAVLVCVGELVSKDPGGLDLRLEHFHCFSDHGEGGHYHYDTTPNDVQYRGYFTLADYVYRIDQPPETHNMAR